MKTRASTAQTERVPFKLESLQATAPIVRLWLLRMLIPLGAHKKFIAYIAERFEMTGGLLLELEHWIEQEENNESDRKSALKKLTIPPKATKIRREATKLHRETTKLHRETIKIRREATKLHRETAKLRRATRKELREDWIIQALGLEHWIEQEENDAFDKKSALKELLKLHKAAEKELKNAKVPDPIANKIKRNAEVVKRLSETVKLSETDCRIFEMAELFRTERSLAYMKESFAPCDLDLQNHHEVASVLSVLLALPQDEIHSSICSILSLLFSEMMALPQNEICLTSLKKASELGTVKTIWIALRWAWRRREKI